MLRTGYTNRVSFSMTLRSLRMTEKPKPKKEFHSEGVGLCPLGEWGMDLWGIVCLALLPVSLSCLTRLCRQGPTSFTLGHAASSRFGVRFLLCIWLDGCQDGWQQASEQLHSGICYDSSAKGRRGQHVGEFPEDRNSRKRVPSWAKVLWAALHTSAPVFHCFKRWWLRDAFFTSWNP